MVDMTDPWKLNKARLAIIAKARKVIESGEELPIMSIGLAHKIVRLAEKESKAWINMKGQHAASYKLNETVDSIIEMDNMG